jgi:hypothetical protein
MVVQGDWTVGGGRMQRGDWFWERGQAFHIIRRWAQVERPVRRYLPGCQPTAARAACHFQAFPPPPATSHPSRAHHCEHTVISRSRGVFPSGDRRLSNGYALAAGAPDRAERSHQQPRAPPALTVAVGAGTSAMTFRRTSERCAGCIVAVERLCCLTRDLRVHLR